MSNWLGFSLSPHLRIDEGFGSGSSSSSGRREDHHHQAAAVMPLRSDGSLSFVDPFSRAADWRYENMAMDGEVRHHHVHASENCPKFEDFLGCYSNSPPHYQEEDSHRINVNVPPCFNINGEDIEPAAAAGENSTTNSSYHHFHENPQTLNLCDPNPEIRSTYSAHVPFESASVSSVAGFKSWLRQTTTFDQKSTHEAANFQTLSLTMTSPDNCQNEIMVVDNRKRPAGAVFAKSSAGNKEAVPRKSLDTFGQRTSQYRGVTRHRWTGRYEAHLWDNSCRKEGQTRKGRQVYLGGYDKEEKAARAYDLAALKYWGPTTHINFPLSTYEKELEEMKNMSRQEFVANLRRKSSGFSRGASVYRGVTRHHQHGRWQARIGRVAGNKDLYLGTFSTQEEAAEAYDIAAIKFRGTSAVTNFGISRYDVKRICSSSTLITSELAKRSSKDSGPTALEEYNSCASSTSQPLLAICSSEASDELADMVWGANMDETQQKRSGYDTNIEAKMVGSCSRDSSINAASPRCPVRLASDFGIGGGGGGYSESCFPSQGAKYEGNDGSANRSSDHQNVGNSDLVQRSSMFALWND